MHQLRARRPGRALAAALVLAGLLPRPVLGAPSAPDQEIAAAERRVEGAAVTLDDYVALASAFMRKSRESGDPGYYARANAAVERALALDSNHYGALRAAPWVLLGLHGAPACPRTPGPRSCARSSASGRARSSSSGSRAQPGAPARPRAPRRPSSTSA